VYINGAKAPLDNIHVRIGLQHALNWEKVLAIEFRGELDRLRTTSDGFGRFTNTTIVPRSFSVEQARKEFAAAGFTQTGSDGILKNQQGQRLSIQLTIREVSLHRRIGLRLKEEARKAGLELAIEALDNTSAFKKLREKNHQLSISAWNSTPPYPVYWEGYHSDNAFEKNADGSIKMNPDGTRKTKPNTNNISSTASPELDKVIDRFEKAETLDVLIQSAHECERLIHEDAGFSPGWGAPWLRYGYWRWVRWPKDFTLKICDTPIMPYVLWIDEDIKTETLRARKSGTVLSEPVENVFDQYRAK
jgi:microcin C transport system substrate-binding protein